MSKHNRAVKCAVEALEDRQLLTVTTMLLGGGTILQITGDASSEEVHITQNDVDDVLTVSWNNLTDSSTGSPSVIPMPAQVFQSSTIQRVVVKLGGGDDDFTYVLQGNQLNVAKSISIDLGAGQDTALFDFGGNIVVAQSPPEPTDINGDGELDFPIDWAMPTPAELNANLSIDVQGNAGNDTIDAIFGHINQNLTYRATGGLGDDTLSSHTAGFTGPDSHVLYDLDGGAGQDQLWVDLGNSGIAAGAKVRVFQRGGLGNDVMNINAHMPLYGSLNLYQLGGAGHDTMKTTAQFDWQSTGRLVARSNGEVGGDQMTLQIKRDPMPPNIMLFAPLADMKVDALLNGGSGKNLAWVTPNVRVFLAKVVERA